MMLIFWVAYLHGAAFREGQPQAAVQGPPAAPRTHSQRPDALDVLLVSLDQEAGGSELSAIGQALKGVVGSKHDFSGLTGRVSDACSACHVPHLQAVLPTQRDGNQAALDLFRIGNQREVPAPRGGAPGASSLICLSCHNGAITVSTIGTAHAMIGAHRGGFALGDFAVRDHPIGVPYPSGARDYFPAAKVLNLGIRLPDNRVECISCHDPHNRTGLPKLLSVTSKRSALCLACHDK